RGGRGGTDPAGVDAAVERGALDRMGTEAAEQIGIRPERSGLEPEVIERSLERQAPDVVYRDAAHLDGGVMREGREAGRAVDHDRAPHALEQRRQVLVVDVEQPCAEPELCPQAADQAAVIVESAV